MVRIVYISFTLLLISCSPTSTHQKSHPTETKQTTPNSSSTKTTTNQLISKSSREQLCQAWFPKEITSKPPATLVACKVDNDCTYGEVRACCSQFVVAINTSRKDCLAKSTHDANCRALCKNPPKEFKRTFNREGFKPACINGACMLRIGHESMPISKDPFPF